MLADQGGRISQLPPRLIDRRRVPPVAGLDKEHALNFLEVAECGPEYAYECYTSGRTFYQQGSRPVLERIVEKFVPPGGGPAGQIESLAEWLINHVLWAGYYEKQNGRKLSANRAASEEELIESGFGWCNEQARLFCALVQIAGYPSRLVFASDAEGLCGHVVSEILTPDGWLVVDQSLGVAFWSGGRPVSAWEVCHSDDSVYTALSSFYQECFAALQLDLGREILSDSFQMALMQNPLMGFTRVGVQNYFIH